VNRLVVVLHIDYEEYLRMVPFRSVNVVPMLTRLLVVLSVEFSLAIETNVCKMTLIDLDWFHKVNHWLTEEYVAVDSMERAFVCQNVNDKFFAVIDIDRDIYM